MLAIFEQFVFESGCLQTPLTNSNIISQSPLQLQTVPKCKTYAVGDIARVPEK